MRVGSRVQLLVDIDLGVGYVEEGEEGEVTNIHDIGYPYEVVLDSGVACLVGANEIRVLR